MVFPRFLLAAACAAGLFAAPPVADQFPAPLTQALERISATSMKGHLSFISSDLLEGRNTPSRGLDIAAEYIAAQFRRAGLDPIPGTNSYFQVANWKYKQIPLEGVKLTFEQKGTKLELDHTHLSLSMMQAVKAENARVFRTRVEDLDQLKEMPEGKLEGWAVLALAPPPGSRTERGRRMRQLSELNTALRRLKPAVVLWVRGDTETGSGARGQLIDPKNPSGRLPFNTPVDAVHSGALAKTVEALPAGETDARLSIAWPDPQERPVELRNVIGVLPGSDPQLKDTYILLSAHYDHIGTSSPQDGDGVYNGANDDGSGTVSVIELASMFSSLRQRPKRTLVFMTVFGEEKGLLGALYYARNPVFPLARTIADVNLEHMGRTDSDDGPAIGKLSMTGYDYSDLAGTFVAAGKLTDVEIVKHPTNSDTFFARSDNAAFAEFGVPAHTFCVAFEFPDYHGLGDHWEKIDYENMARVDRTVAAAVWLLSERLEPPRWNESNPKTEKYRTARAGEGNKGNQ